MIKQEQIEQLESFDARGARVLSAYLSLEPARRVQRTYRVMFEDLVKEVRQRLNQSTDKDDDSTRKDLEADANTVRRWLENEEPRGKSLSIFTCAARQLWQAHFLPVCIKDHLAYEPWPDVAILLEAVDDYERYAVALVDKRNARLFSVFLGEIEEHDVFADDVPNKHHQGGVAQGRLQRRHEAHVRWHLKRVEQHLSSLLRRRRFDRLIVAGPEEATSELGRLLPRVLAHRLVAVIPAEMASSDAEILDRTLEIERRIEREFEDRLLKELLDTSLAHGRATYGIQPTLKALWLGEVQTLVVADGVRVSGGECPNCGYLQTGTAAACSACGTAIRPSQDLFHRAMGRALEQAGSVEVVHDTIAQRLQREGGGIGALLRFR